MRPEGFDAAVAALKKGPIADQGGLLKIGGRKELEAAIARWRSKGLDARILLIRKKADLAPWLPAWQALQVNQKTGLLIVFNGRIMQARGWGLTSRQISSHLSEVRALDTYYAKKLVAALDRLGAEATGEPAPKAQVVEEASSLMPVALGAMAVAGLVGWTIRRRQQRSARQKAVLDEAVNAAEETYADLMLACETWRDTGPGTPGAEEADTLRRRASRLKQDLDKEVANARRGDGAEGAPGRVQAIDNQLAELHSSMLRLNAARGGTQET